MDYTDLKEILEYEPVRKIPVRTRSPKVPLLERQYYFPDWANKIGNKLKNICLIGLISTVALSLPVIGSVMDAKYYTNKYREKLNTLSEEKEDRFWADKAFCEGEYKWAHRRYKSILKEGFDLHAYPLYYISKFLKKK
tara:strand:+ start:13915 stop:14328 length:414 start_codon:yes stop_codon:yes gene_type:complete